MRYFLELAYRGTAFHGWQRQPEARSVQQTVEEALSTLCNAPVEIMGCGRTDAGVHASYFVAHFDTATALPERFAGKLDRYLDAAIAVRRIVPVADSAHARFDATHRAYRYDLIGSKDPFRTDTATYYPRLENLDPARLRAAAALLLDYREFYPFCKAHTDAKTMRCELRRSAWERTPAGWSYHIAADRFLRGMVRLIVGMCLRVAEGKTTLDEVREALETQTRLARPWSAPPQGLFLTEVRYPEGVFDPAGAPTDGSAG